MDLIAKQKLPPIFAAMLPPHLPPQLGDDGTWSIAVDHRDALQALMQTANTTKTPVSLPGMLPPQPTHVRLSLAGMNRVHRHRTEEFLVTVDTGITCGALADVLAKNGQRMALPFAEDRLLLDALATPILSLSATRHGRMHAWVAGLEAITGDGAFIHYGGEVVKNVTGYDLTRLFLYTCHRHGIITRATLKLVAAPEMTRSALFHVPDLPGAVELARRIMSGVSSPPESLVLFRTKTSFGMQLLVTLSGVAPLVRQDSEAVDRWVSHLNPDLQELSLTPKAVAQWQRRLDWLHPEEPDALVVRIALTENLLLDLPYRFSQWPWLNTADLLMPLNTNQLWLRWIAVGMPEPQSLLNLQVVVRELGGLVDLLRVPHGGQWDVARFNANPQPKLQEWADRVKAAYDPNGILSGQAAGEVAHV